MWKLTNCFGFQKKLNHKHGQLVILNLSKDKHWVFKAIVVEPWAKALKNPFLLYPTMLIYAEFQLPYKSGCGRVIKVWELSRFLMHIIFNRKLKRRFQTCKYFSLKYFC